MYKHIDIMQIKLNKQKEDNEFVWYQFEINVTTEYYKDLKKREMAKIEPRFGLIKFKKTGPVEETTYEIIEEKTDQEILADPNFKHVIWGCLYVLMQCKRKGIYPEKTAYQCG